MLWLLADCLFPRWCPSAGSRMLKEHAHMATPGGDMLAACVVHSPTLDPSCKVS